MIPKLQKRGTSFKDTCRYVLHDVQADTSERVAWVGTQNLASHHEDAWYEMMETAKAQDRLKAASGVDARGRKNERPVLHFSLSWAPPDDPTVDHMRQTATSALKALGLEEHEALIVAHKDKDHPHVHIVANTIHPYTGRTADLKFAKLRISRWAEAYEREHGIHCAQRLQNNDDRKVIGEQRDGEARDILVALARGETTDERAPYVPLKDRSPNRRDWMSEKALGTLAADILQGLTRMDSTFSRQDLARIVNGKTPDASSFERLMAKIEGSEELVRLPGEAGRLSTRTMVQTEHDMMASAQAMAGNTSHPVTTRSVAAANLARLTEGQRDAMLHVVGGTQLASVVGLAGTGKSTMLGEARKVWEAEGYTVQGAALSGIAAEGLQDGSGIPSRTIHGLQWSLAHGTSGLGPRDIVVIDEAGMVGSRQMQAVMAEVQKAGAKLVLVGDPAQLRPIEAGAAFRAIIEKTGAARIGEVVRQSAAWQRIATQDLARGNTAEAIESYRNNGDVHVHSDKSGAVESVVAAWAKDAGATSQGALMLAATNADVQSLNAEARLIQKARGVLGRETQLVAWDESIDRPRSAFRMQVAIGERLMFTRNDHRLGVKNGTIGTLVSLSAQEAVLKLDGPDARAVAVDLNTYRNFVYGYALTIHKSQGATAAKVHVLAGRSMDQNLTYVALSRHRDGISLHYDQETFPSAGRLDAVLSRERSKDTTLDYLRQPERVQAQTITQPHVRDDGRVSPAFARSSGPAKPSDRIRGQMRDYGTRNPGRDFGREF